VVVVAPGHWQLAWQMPVNAPVHELPGGSHVSPASIVPSPHCPAIVVLVEVVVVVTVGTDVVVVPAGTVELVVEDAVVEVVEMVLVVVVAPGHWQLL